MRRVKANGTISWRGKRVFVSEALEAEPVALAEVEGGRWEVRYGPILLGFLADRGQRLIRPKKALMGLWTTPGRCPQGPQPPQPQTARTEDEIVSGMSSVRIVRDVAGCA